MCFFPLSLPAGNSFWEQMFVAVIIKHLFDFVNLFCETFLQILIKISVFTAYFLHP